MQYKSSPPSAAASEPSGSALTLARVHLTSQYDPIAQLRKTLPSDVIYELEEQLADLEKNPGYQRLMELVEIGRERLTQIMVDERFPDIAAQQRFAGFVAGVGQIQNVAEFIRSEAKIRRERIEGQAARDEARPKQLAPDGLTPVS